MAQASFQYRAPPLGTALGPAPWSSAVMGPSTLEQLKALSGVPTAPVAPTAPQVAPTPPVINFPDLLSKAAEASGGIGDWLGANYGPGSQWANTWTDPEASGNWPLPRSQDQTGSQNLAAGFANSLLHAPQNLWQAYSKYVGGPFAQATQPAVRDTYDWLTTPESTFKANKAAAAEAAQPQQEQPQFTPGLPRTTNKIVQAESGGNNFAKNVNSSAYGPAQFIKSTWLQFMKEAHPDKLTELGKDKALVLRSDPALADEATAWYAGKAVDVLDSIDAPPTDANIYLHHFLGPQGVKDLLTADPNSKVSDVLPEAVISANKSVLGGTTTVQDVVDWAGVKMGDYASQPPTPRPQVPMPDFAAANNWYDKAAPQPLDPETLKNMQLAMFVSGLSGGLGKVNGRESGAAAVIGAAASGAGQGAYEGKKLALNAEDLYNQRYSEYAGNRAGVAEEQASIASEVAGKNSERAWQDTQDTEAWKEQQSAANLLKTQPKILNSSANGLWIQPSGGGAPEFLPSGNTTQLDQIETLGKTLGADSGSVRQLKYNSMLQTPGMNTLTFMQEVVRDVLKDGLGPSIWGEGYTEALSAAQDEANKAAPGLAAKPELLQEQIVKILSGLLLGASQSAGNYDWITQAAAQGNPGAIMLLQGGSTSGGGEAGGGK